MSRKRSLSDSDSSSERIPSKIQKYWDPYCWLCHEKDTEQRCSKCNLTYHLRCIGFDGQKIKQYKCDLCERIQQARDDYEKRKVNMEEFHRMLSYVVERIMADKSFARFKTFEEREPPQGGPSLINPYNLEIVQEKVDDNQYKSSAEFLKDIRQIRHNAEIVMTTGMKGLTIARELDSWCAKEMYDIEMCGQCYERANDSSKVNDWFTEICDPPHLLVWAKLTGHPYWPAKVIGITTTSNHLDVRFFGDHDMAKVSPQDCFLYPSKNPNKPLEASVEEQVKASVAEAEKYLERIEAKYGCAVPMLPLRTSLVVRDIGRHLRKMIPKLQLPGNFKLKRKPSYLQRMQSRKSRTSSSRQPRQPRQQPPPQSSLTPPPSPPSPTPSPSSLSSALPAILPHSIKHKMSANELQKMSQFAVLIQRCDEMPEFKAIFEKRDNDIDVLPPVNDLISENSQSTQNEDKPNVMTPINQSAIEDDTFEIARSEVSEESIENFESDANEAHSNDGNMVSNADDHDIEQIDDIEQMDDSDEYEEPSPQIEFINTEMPLHVNAEQLHMENQQYLGEIRNLRLSNQILITENQNLNETINQLRSSIGEHIKEKNAVQAELSKSLADYAKRQQQHSIELEKAIADTKNKQWCVKCKNEAFITKYKVPVCSSTCLMQVFVEKQRAQEANFNELEN